jgi:hypothetical protein
MSFDAFEPARWAMGDTVRFAERMNLIEMEPRGDLTWTGYALASPGEEYTSSSCRAHGADPFTVTLDAGTYSVEWFTIEARETTEADEVTVEGSAPTS